MDMSIENNNISNIVISIPQPRNVKQKCKNRDLLFFIKGILFNKEWRISSTHDIKKYTHAKGTDTTSSRNVRLFKRA